MDVTLRNATVYTRLIGQPLAILSTEPATSPGSVDVQGQAAGSSSTGSLNSWAIAGIVVGCIAAVALLVALAVFGFLRLRRRRQQAVADRKLGVTTSEAVHWYIANGNSSSTSRWGSLD